MEKLVFENLDALHSLKGKPLPVGEWFTVTQQMINDFANATLDKQWIHVDEEKAAKYSPTGTTIAHGFMSVSMLSELISELIEIKSVKMGLNYGLNKVRFPNPVPVNSQLRLLSSLKEIEDFNNGKKLTFDCLVEIKGQEKPACVAEFIFVLLE
ncbi:MULTISPECIES: MaoC family dehydratase [unclassified Tenacibaculum]|uniref:MaoC family dehydratase n=1 Tax=unclassified Tenacibaculum TaxID=2635139 RepID=UPI001F2615F0|nr:MULTISPECIES: MaoC family dehydratase [unclassified Tenacibaculum]MCF2874216.1 MaoC family dehydratase [Tenacibaculum sp. Cn5-1]MCF2934797.1 MaoC family dehydratase [Tenacibaculum sp. Cn5-34]MCG7511007.1 MaoC family dehydratase [Tenacibaculum sp. Cn5-46]